MEAEIQPFPQAREAALAALHRTERPRLESYLRRQVAHPDVAADLASETFIVALQREEVLIGLPAEQRGPWLFGIAVNLLAHHHRSEATLARALRRLPPSDASADVDDAEEVFQRVDAPHLQGLLERAMEKLPANQRRAVRMRVVDELPYQQVAAGFDDVDPQLARAWVSRGLHALAISLAAAAGLF